MTTLIILPEENGSSEHRRKSKTLWHRLIEPSNVYTILESGKGQELSTMFNEISYKNISFEIVVSCKTVNPKNFK